MHQAACALSFLCAPWFRDLGQMYIWSFLNSTPIWSTSKWVLQATDRHEIPSCAHSAGVLQMYHSRMQWPVAQSGGFNRQSLRPGTLVCLPFLTPTRSNWVVSGTDSQCVLSCTLSLCASCFGGGERHARSPKVVMQPPCLKVELGDWRKRCVQRFVLSSFRDAKHAWEHFGCLPLFTFSILKVLIVFS